MTNGRKVVIALAVIAVLAVGVFLARRVHAPVPGDISYGPMVAPMVEEHSTTTYAVMDLSYPQSSPAKYPEIWSFVQASKTDFSNIISGDTDHVIADSIARTGSKYVMNMATEVATSSRTVSYKIYVYMETGGAHGGTSVRVFTYDKNGKLVTLDDIFNTTEKSYLAQIAPLARAYLYNKLGEYAVPNMLDSGTEPTADNYSAWYLTNSAIVFIFGQYQVGPYVIGIQEFPLEKSAISDSLSPDYK